MTSEKVTKGMDLGMRQEILLDKIKTSHLSLIESQQVNRRLKNLHSQLLNQTKQKLRKSRSPSDVERYALNDPEYLEFLDQIIETSHSQTKSRVEFETHLMLYNARQSLRKHRRL